MLLEPVPVPWSVDFLCFLVWWCFFFVVVVVLFFVVVVVVVLDWPDCGSELLWPLAEDWSCELLELDVLGMVVDCPLPVCPCPLVCELCELLPDCSWPLWLEELVLADCATSMPVPSVNAKAVERNFFMLPLLCVER